MKAIKFFMQWLIKTGLFIGYTALTIQLAMYFIKGGNLIVDDAIPIEALGSCCFTPFFLLGAMIMVYVISETEKRIEQDTSVASSDGAEK